MKIILNKCYGGFNVSTAGYRLYAKKKGFELYPYVMAIDPKYKYHIGEYSFEKIEWEKIRYTCAHIHYFIKDYGDKISRRAFNEIEDDYLWLEQNHRTDPVLIEVVEELGKEASGAGSDLRVVEIPDDMEWVIDKHDGLEVLHQKVQTW